MTANLYTQGLVSLLPGPWSVKGNAGIPIPIFPLAKNTAASKKGRPRVLTLSPQLAQPKPCSQYPHSKGEASLPCSWVATQCQQLSVIIHDQAQPAARAWQHGLLRLHYPSLQPKLEGQTIDTQAQSHTLTPMPQTTRLLNKGRDPCGHGNLQPVFKISTICL